MNAIPARERPAVAGGRTGQTARTEQLSRTEQTSPAEQTDRVRLKPKKLRETPWRAWAIRFGFGAGVSALAGTVSALAGPHVGGLFLAFPAILLASLTLVAKEDGVRPARDDARGAAIGTLGLLAFAVVTAALAATWPVWAALLAATLAWAFVSLGGYLVLHRLGRGGDEPPSG